MTTSASGCLTFGTFSDTLLSAATAGRRRGRRSASTTAAGNCCADAARPDALDGVEVDDGLAVVQSRAQFGVSFSRDVALGLDDLVFGRHADVCLALRRFKTLQCQFTR